MLGDAVTEPEVRAVGVTDFRPWADAPHHVARSVEDDYTRDWEVRSPIGVLTMCVLTRSPRASRCSAR